MTKGFSGGRLDGGGAVTEPPPFAELLRELRTGAGLTQEELAERSRLSPRSISDLERGIHSTARRVTTQLLADALELTGQARMVFEAVAQGRSLTDSFTPTAFVLGTSTASALAVATRTLPRDVSSFTGREAELDQLLTAVTEHVKSGLVAAIYAIGGMAGIGKTAFAVHAAHLLAPRFPHGQIFLPLHGHTPGHQPVDPADALASLLQTAGVAPQQIPPDLEPRTRMWRDYLVDKQMLLLLDDAAGHEQVRPLLPGTAGSLVLVTSRRHLTALEDAQAISLETLTPESAADLLIRVASRPDISATDGAVREIAALCGGLPLAVGMLARQLHHHTSWTAAGMAADLTAARDQLGLMRAENLSVAAAFDLSYQDLTSDQQRMFRRLGLHPGVDIDAYAAAALDNAELAVARRNLEAIYDQYLLAEPIQGRYRFHDLISMRARSLASGDPADERSAAMDRLLDYYLNAATAADRYLIRRTPAARLAGSTPRISKPVIPGFANREQAIRWMNAERLDLHAAARYAAAHDRPGDAVSLAEAMHGFLRSQGHWVEALALYRTALTAASELGDPLAQAGALADLGDIQTLSGDYQAATETHERALGLYRDLGDRLGEANALNKLATVQQAAGKNRPATANLIAALALHRDLGDRLGEANDLNQLGVVQYETGEYRAATVSHELALELRRELGDQLGEATALLRLGALQQATGNYPAAMVSLTLALKLHRESGYRFGEATVLGQLCGVLHETGKYAEASVIQREALTLYQVLGYPRGQADAIRHLGAIRHAVGDDPPAASEYGRALELYRGIRFRLGEAEVLNDLGELFMATGASGDAHAFYEDALAIARDISSLPEQARAMEGIGRAELSGSQNAKDARNPDQLRAALLIYERIGSWRAQRVRELLASSD
jgi:tetratricopeptide (TPR) repeat protein/transcriptional regulator with XRE-family HTH domain